MEFHQIVVTVQYPIVMILALASFQAARAFGRRRLYIVGAGWLANLGYLVAHSLRSAARPDSSAGLGDLPILEDLLVLTCSGLFLLATLLPKPSRENFWRRVPVTLVVAFSLLILTFALTVISHLPPSESQSFKIFHACADVALHSFALLQLAMFYRSYIPDPPRWFGLGLLTLGAGLYAIIQPLYLIALLVGKTLQYHINLIGFSLGFIFKTIIALGYLYLFVSIAMRAERDRARLAEAKRIVGRINHEVGTPLSEMMLLVQGLQYTAPAHGKAREQINQIENALHRVEAIMDAARDVMVMISNIPVLSEGPAANKESKPTVVNVNSLIHRAVIAVKATRSEVVSWRFHYSGNCCVRCIPAEMVQVFINLLRNAYDALPNGQGTITIHTSKLRREEAVRLATDFPLPEFETGSRGSGQPLEVTHVSIKDTGEGIDTSDLEIIFKEGFSTRHGDGRGYGLAVVKNLVARNGGILQIRSPVSPDQSVRKGTEVLLSFPRLPCRKGGANGDRSE